MVETLNVILFTAQELFELRMLLKELNTEVHFLIRYKFNSINSGYFVFFRKVVSFFKHCIKHGVIIL